MIFPNNAHRMFEGVATYVAAAKRILNFFSVLSTRALQQGGVTPQLRPGSKCDQAVKALFEGSVKRSSSHIELL